MKNKKAYQILSGLLCSVMLMGTVSTPVYAAELFSDGTEMKVMTELSEKDEASIVEETTETMETSSLEKAENLEIAGNTETDRTTENVENAEITEPSAFLAGEEDPANPEFGDGENPELETEDDILAAEEATSGTIKGTKINWNFKDGVMTLSGQGATPYRIEITDLETGEVTIENKMPWEHLISKIKEIRVEKGITELGSQNFDGCENLQKVTIASTVKKIGSFCFNKCRNLTEINLTDGLEILDEAVFNYCPVTSFTLPSTIKASKDYQNPIGLEGMINLENVYVKGKSTSCRSIDGVIFLNNGTELAYYPCARKGSYVIPDGTKVLTQAVFAGVGLTSIKIPDSVTRIDENAFYYCYDLKEITFPKKMKKLPDNVCEDCESLVSVTLPKGLTEIGDMAFWDCKALKNINLPETLKTIGKKAFNGCEALESVKLPASLSKFAEDSFDEHTKFVIDKPIPNFHKVETGEYKFAFAVTVRGINDYKKAFELLSLINKERKNAGVPSLVMDKKLLENAMQRAAETVLSPSHTRPVNLPYYSMNPEISGELMAGWDQTPTAVKEYWMTGFGYRINLLSTDYRSAGIGCVIVNGSYHWILCFGEKKATTAKASAYPNKTVKRKVLVSPESEAYQPSFKLTATKFRKGQTAKVQIFWSYNALPYSGATIVSSNSKVCKVENGVLRGVAPGTATISVYYGEDASYAMKQKVTITK